MPNILKIFKFLDFYVAVLVKISLTAVQGFQRVTFSSVQPTIKCLCRGHMCLMT